MSIPPTVYIYIYMKHVSIHEMETATSYCQLEQSSKSLTGRFYFIFLICKFKMWLKLLDIHNLFLSF
jgi:hypothetical protein